MIVYIHIRRILNAERSADVAKKTEYYNTGNTPVTMYVVCTMYLYRHFVVVYVQQHYAGLVLDVPQKMR